MPTTPPGSPGPAAGDGRRARRDFLRLAALAPLAAGCASLPAAARGPAPGRGAGAPATPAPAVEPVGAALAAVRDFPLPADAEPASLFRAEVARGRGG